MILKSNKYNINFHINSYKALINSILKSNRKIISFNDILDGENGIVMRHDIDFCPVRAEKIAVIEAQKKIKAIYFILIKTSIYNFLEPINFQALKNIILLGHDIGLHFDPKNYSDQKISLELACKKECELLEEKFNIKINTVSFHRPEKKYIGLNKKIGGRIHTYMPDFINSTKYCSDSQGEWRYENPERVLFDRKLQSIQLLTHPIWWTTPKELSPGEKVAFHLKNATDEQHKLAAENCRPYKLFLKKRKNLD